MAAIEINLKTFLTGVVPANSIQYSKIFQTTELPFIWFERSGVDADLLADGSPALTTTTFNLEVVDSDPDNAQNLANQVRTLLHGYRGAFGADSVQSVFVLDQNDDYTPYNVDQDNGIYPIALQLEITT